MERSFYNRVSELGYSDILIEIPKGRTGVVVELQQIEEKDYMARLKQDGMRQFIKYGIACYKKDCKVMIVVYMFCEGYFDCVFRFHFTIIL